MSKFTWAMLAVAAVGAGPALAQTTAPTPAAPMTAAPAPMGATMAPMPATKPATLSTTNPAPAGAPVAGANSFTENQARKRIEDMGYTNVMGLKKDDQSIWRGTAMKDGATMPVALDFKGNVVASAATKP